MMGFWQNLPLGLSQAALIVGPFLLTWYALFYVTGAFVMIWYLFRENKRKQILPEDEDFWDLVLWTSWGVLLGARLGFVLLYGGNEFWNEPWRIFSPYDFVHGVWTGIRGMSFFGGLMGGILSLFFFAKKRNFPLLSLSDFIVPALPLALLFGRLGNFLNGELFGRVTLLPWGMRFLNTSSELRHPSQLYEAMGEGLFLFFILQWFEKKQLKTGVLSVLFLILYGGVRFGLEFWREPDEGAILFLGIFTLNQVMALGAAALGALGYRFFTKKVV